MSDKQNFYIEQSLLEKSAERGSISGAITSALKIASENVDDFVYYTKRWLAERLPMEGLPQLRDIVEGGQLKHNLLADFGGLKIFVSRGTEAKLVGTELKVAKPNVSIFLGTDMSAKWATCDNDFNGDSLCIELTDMTGVSDG